MTKHHERIQFLIEKYKSGLLNHNERIELATYLHSEEGKKTVHEDMNKSFAEMVKDDAALIPLEVSLRMRDRLIQEIQPWSQANPITQRLWFKGMVAAILLLIGGWWAAQTLIPGTDIEWQTMQTVLGEQKQITLPDGTVIFLNGGATIHTPKHMSALDYRIIKLNGEAFFDVAPDSTRPFFVVTPDFSIRVLGTSFNVDTDLEQSVTVYEGKVHVMKIDEISVTKNLDNLPNVWSHFEHSNPRERISTPHVLRLEDKENLASSLVALGPLEKVDVGEHTGLSKVNVTNTNNWMHKDLAFYDQSLELVVQQLERFYGKEITIDPALSGCKITLAANKKTLDEALNGLVRLIRDGQIKTIEDRLLISGSKCQ